MNQETASRARWIMCAAISVLPMPVGPDSNGCRWPASSEHRAPSIPDLLIAATAELSRLTVLHVDKDFDLIAAITDQPIEPTRTDGPVRCSICELGTLIGPVCAE